MPKISVVVPVYNCEKYLNRCVDSILSQSFQDFEIILINDGSSDNSSVICDEYRLKDCKIKVIHKLNAGVSAARNSGIDIAVGEYIMFIDSDDYIDNNMFEIMFNYNNKSYDLIASGLDMDCYDEVTGKKDIISYKMLNKEYNIKTLFEGLEIDYPLICICGPCCKLYKRNIINKYDIAFDEAMSLGEDTYFNLNYFEHCDTVLTINESFYHYNRQNTNSLFSKYHENSYEIHRKIYDRMRNIIIRNNCDNNCRNKFEQMYYKMLLNCVTKLFQNTDNTKIILRKNIINELIHNMHIVENLKYFKFVKIKDIIISKVISLKNVILIYLMFYFYYNLILSKKRPHVKRKILLNIYLSTNLGDDLFLDILLRRYPDVEFTILKIITDYKYFLSNYSNVKIFRYNFFHKILNKLNIYLKYISWQFARNNDAFIYLGGSIFMEQPSHSMQYKKNKIYVDAFNKKSKPVFILGSNFGPFYTESFLSDYKLFFDKCYDISFRDTYSYNILSNYNNKVRHNPDIVFGIKKLNSIKQKAIGFSIIDLYERNGLQQYEEVYLLNIISLINKAIQQQYKVVLFSFCEYEGDLKVIDKIIKLIPQNISEKIEVHNYEGNLKDTLNRLSEMELMVATRFHANILSQVFEQGVLPIIYSEKTMNALSDIKLNDIYVNIKDNEIIDADIIWEKLICNKININKISTMSIRHFEFLDKYISSLKKDPKLD